MQSGSGSLLDFVEGQLQIKHIFVSSRNEKMEPQSYWGGSLLPALGGFEMVTSGHPLVPKTPNACFLALALEAALLFIVCEGLGRFLSTSIIVLLNVGLCGRGS